MSEHTEPQEGNRVPSPEPMVYWWRVRLSDGMYYTLLARTMEEAREAAQERLVFITTIECVSPAEIWK